LLITSRFYDSKEGFLMTNSCLFNQRGVHYLYPKLSIGLGVLLVIVEGSAKARERIPN
jgi:hypothetical protein